MNREKKKHKKKKKKKLLEKNEEKKNNKKYKRRVNPHELKITDIYTYNCVVLCRVLGEMHY